MKSLWTVKQVARALGCHQNKVYLMLGEDLVPHMTKVGNRHRFGFKALKALSIDPKDFPEIDSKNGISE